MAGHQELEHLYESRGSGLLRGLGELANVSSRTLPACTKDRFATYYPFFPYQVHLLPEIVKTLCSKGGRGERMAGSTRTLLAITQDILRAGRRRYLDQPVGAIVSYDELYNKLSGEGEVSPDVRTELSRIKDVVPGATTLTPRVAEVLFLIREVPFIPRSKDNIARLLVETVDDDLPTILARIEPELARRWIDTDVVTYREQEFYFKPVIDETAVSGAKGDVTLRLYSPLRLGRETLEDLESRSLRADEQTTLFFLCGRVNGFDQDLTRYLAMKEVIVNRKGDPHKSEDARKLAQDRENDDLPKLERRVVDGLKDGLRTGHLVFRGSSRQNSMKAGQTSGMALRTEMAAYWPALYPRFDKVPVRIVNEQKAIQDVLAGETNTTAE